VLIIPDATTEALEFDAGNIDWMASILSPDIEERYAADPAYEGSLKRGLSTAAFWLALNPAMEPFDDIRVRQAVASILERESIVEAGGQGVPGYTLIHPTLPGHDPTFNPYPIDVDAAQLLLEEAGYADGVSFEIHVWNIPGFIAMAEVMQQQLLDAGLDVELRVVDFGTMMAEASEGTYAAFFNLGNIFVPDPAEFLYGLFYSESALNVNYLNEDVDRLLEEAIAEPDIAARGELVAEADRLIVEDAVAIPYQFRVTATLFQPWVHGHEDHNQTEASGQTTLRWSDLWLDPEYRE
jgi:peptide/nickel transport system substrate-binding protein